jgi:hypothetical protein
MAYWMFVVTSSTTCVTHDAIASLLYSDFAADYDIVKGTDEDWQEIELRWSPDGASPDEPKGSVLIAMPVARATAATPL